VYVAWSEQTQYGGLRSMLARSSDGGSTFSPPIDVGPYREENYGHGWTVPVVRNDGAVVLLQFERSGDPFFDGVCSGLMPTISVSTNGGSSFTTPAAHPGCEGYFASGRAFAWNQQVTKFGVVPQGQYSSACRELNTLSLAYYTSSDYGVSWTRTELLPAGGNARGHATVGITGSERVIVAWQEASTFSRTDIQVRGSSDGGASFAPPSTGGMVSGALSTSAEWPIIRVFGEHVTLLFSAGDIKYAAVSTDGGRTFSAPAAVASEDAVRALGTGRLSHYDASSGRLRCSASNDDGAAYSLPVVLTGAASITAQSTSAQAGGATGPLFMTWTEGSNIYIGDFRDVCR
jgi:hypothetical protein